MVALIILRMVFYAGYDAPNSEIKGFKRSTNTLLEYIMVFLRKFQQRRESNREYAYLLRRRRISDT
uniref:Uncharacterized protein n=1 Tax=Solanum lycopersicum TaxID=4081 RepID=A0A3Q7G129_SOLLC